MIKKTIYLAGPMDFATSEQQLNWRKIATNRLIANGFDILDPTKRPHTADLNNKEIFTLDMVDVEKSDLLFVDCRDLKIPIFGTPCEIFYASHVLKKPVIGWYDTEYKPKGKRVFQEVLVHRTFSSLYLGLNHIVDFYK